MHLAYSALRNTTKTIDDKAIVTGNQYHLRHVAYKAACNKYSREIAAIQKYLPGWTPAFPAAI
jgi:hypothetical protein